MKHGSCFIVAAIALHSRAHATGPTLPVNIDASTQALSTVAISLEGSVEIESLNVESRIFGTDTSVREANSGELILENLGIDGLGLEGMDIGIIDVADDFMLVENPQRVDLPLGVYCEQLTLRALVAGYDSEVEATRFAYFEVTGDAIEPIAEGDYASAALTQAPIVNAQGESVIGSAGRGQPASQAELDAPSEAAVLVQSGDTGLGGTDLSERNQ